jgi:nucleotide-binding universal stress UspA family protein
MKKILLPVDGSESALRAVDHVIKLAKDKEGLMVTLLYVHYEPVPYGAVAGQLTAENIKELEQKFAEPVMGEPAKRLEAAGVRVERDFRVAVEIAPMIAKRAEELGCDAIFMGAHGGGSLAKMLVGSTANKVLHLARMPVTLVK